MYKTVLLICGVEQDKNIHTKDINKEKEHSNKTPVLTERM